MLEQKLKQLQRQKQAMEEKMARMESQGKLKKDAAEAALRAAQEELAARTARAGHQRQKELENQKEIAELEAAMKKLTDEVLRKKQSWHSTCFVRGVTKDDEIISHLISRTEIIKL